MKRKHYLMIIIVLVGLVAYLGMLLVTDHSDSYDYDRSLTSEDIANGAVTSAQLANRTFCE